GKPAAVSVLEAGGKDLVRDEAPPAERYPRGEGSPEEAGTQRGDKTVVHRLSTVSRFRAGDTLRIEWAIVFGRSLGNLMKNVRRARETYNGVMTVEGGNCRWMVPARKATRVEAKAQLAPIWIRGEKRPAISIMLSEDKGEEVEWLKLDGQRVESYELQSGWLLIPVETDRVNREAAFTVEGQLTDGTIFTATIEEEELSAFTGDSTLSPHRLPDDCIHLFPNPFVGTLNIKLHVHDLSAFSAYRPNGQLSGTSTVRIYDVKGRLVRSVLEEDYLHPGDYSISWDGGDENGVKVAPGVYYCKFQIGDRSLTKRVILLR
ncbi:MAG: hypothetical protein JXB45_06975, partial [Candidatus Krumholzibacteriota bacterium]|nr:hypothetical protein [Candidatus Krumholzibacteriota bacterium]